MDDQFYSTNLMPKIWTVTGFTGSPGVGNSDTLKFLMDGQGVKDIIHKGQNNQYQATSWAQGCSYSQDDTLVGAYSGQSFDISYEPAVNGGKAKLSCVFTGGSQASYLSQDGRARSDRRRRIPILSWIFDLAVKFVMFLLSIILPPPDVDTGTSWTAEEGGSGGPSPVPPGGVS